MQQTLRVRKFGRAKALGAIMTSIIGLLGALAIIPAVSPSTGAQAADLLRAILGPQPVADIESVSFWMQDTYNQFISRHNGGKLQIELNQNSAQTSSTQQTIVATLDPAKNKNNAIPQNDATPPPDDNAATAAPQIGWQVYGPMLNGTPVMAQALLTVDPERPYAGIALARIDLSKLKLHMAPGFLEPSHTAEIQHTYPNLGLMPEADQSRLIAAFNGGFKAVNGHYGMMVNGVTLLPPTPDLATLAIYRDGHVQLGAWGQDILPTSDIVAYRQNCPLILQNGQMPPSVSVDDRTVWGQTIGNKEATWRTALGITKDNRYLIYAVGNGATVDALALALQEAGANNAMQLDINRHYAHFATYQLLGKKNPSLSAVPLLIEMENNPTIYLKAHSRDFFYLTTP